MKYALVLAPLLITASLALETPEPSFDGLKDFSNFCTGQLAYLKKETQSFAENLWQQYAGATPVIEPTAAETTVSIPMVMVSSAETVTDLSLQVPSEYSLFTTIKSYIVARPYKIGAATITTATALAGGAFYIYSKNK